MENRSHALIAGLFTLFLGISAIAALWWFGGRTEASNDYIVLTTKNVTGLNLQAQVRFRGIRVGKVEAIALDPSDLRNTLIHIRISQDVRLTQGTTATLGYQGVTGIAHILLEDSGKNPAVLMKADGQLPRILMQDSLIQELSEVGAETMRNARDFLANANQLLSPENRRNISNTLSNLEKTTNNAQEATAQLRLLLTPENVRLLNATLVKAEQTAGQAGPFFAEARTLVASLKTVSDKLDSALGEPSAGSAVLPKINELTRELSANSRQLNRVLQMLEDSPQSLIFGRQVTPSGPGEPGFSSPERFRGTP
jgi:phospholipid/cholesterol/gamma-HCH transport system substrate-binding protein